MKKTTIKEQIEECLTYLDLNESQHQRILEYDDGLLAGFVSIRVERLGRIWNPPEEIIRALAKIVVLRNLRDKLHSVGCHIDYAAGLRDVDSIIYREGKGWRKGI